MKKILVGAVASGLIVNSLFADINDYKAGFESAIESIKVQMSNNNIQSERINFKDENVLFIDISSLDSATILLIQHLASRNLFEEVYLSKNKLFLGSYERVADAIKYQRKAEAITGVKTYITSKNSLQDEYTNPLFFKEFYKNLIDKNNTLHIKETIYIEKKEEVKPVVKTVSKPVVKTVPKPTVKHFRLINGKAQSYTLPSEQTLERASNFKEDLLKSTDEKFTYGSTVRTKDGKTFIKVRNKNLYFLSDDVRF